MGKHFYIYTVQFDSLCMAVYECVSFIANHNYHVLQYTHFYYYMHALPQTHRAFYANISVLNITETVTMSLFKSYCSSLYTSALWCNYRSAPDFSSARGEYVEIMVNNVTVILVVRDTCKINTTSTSTVPRTVPGNVRRQSY